MKFPSAAGTPSVVKRGPLASGSAWVTASACVKFDCHGCDPFFFDSLADNKRGPDLRAWPLWASLKGIIHHFPGRLQSQNRPWDQIPPGRQRAGPPR